MKGFPTKEKLTELRERYPEGTRIELVSMRDDPQPVKAGTKGTVTFVDDAGTIHMKWDSGRTLGLVPDVDAFRIITKTERRAMIEAEDKYTFRQSSQISSQTGLIGYLRADMDADGNGFFSSWNDYRRDLKTDEFKQEFDEVINSLREEGDILHNRKDLAYYCYANPQSKMPTEQDYYGVRVDTDKYAYLLRLNPNKGEYNLYCYCYVKDWLNQHLQKAARGIRFINSEYNELFRLPDGGKIKIRYAWGETVEKTCRYLDDYHVEIGTTIYHIAEFAERMEQNGHVYEPVKN